MDNKSSIENLYQANESVSDFQEYLRLSDQVSQAEPDAPDLMARQEALDAYDEAYKTKLLSEIYESIKMASNLPLPALHIHGTGPQPDSRQAREANAVFADRTGVHVGVSFVQNFEVAVFVLTDYLVANFLFQIAPPMGELPPINQVVPLDQFPSEALSLYSAHLIPEAESRDGYTKRPFQILMEYMQAAAFHDPDDETRKPLSRFMPKPPLDLINFYQDFEADHMIENYLHSVVGPYKQKLHLQLLLDGLFFILAHEVAHARLGHFQHSLTDISQMRAYEAAADLDALDMLAKVPGFEVRSLSIVFNFARYHESSAPAEMLDHPLARNRLLILYETILNQPGNQWLYADINASLHLLQTELEPYGLLFGWPDGEPEEVDIFMSHYSDMGYTAHLYVYVERELRNPDQENAWSENAFIFANLVFKITFALRDRIQPDHVYVRGLAAYHPKIRGDDLFIATRENQIYTRLHLPIPAPPEWFLAKPGSELAIENIELSTAEAIMPDDDEEEPPVYFYYEPLEFNIEDFIQSLPAKAGSQESTETLLMAARRYAVYQRYFESSRLYQWLYEHAPETLNYGDLMYYCDSLLKLERFDQAERIAEAAIRQPGQLRPGYHYLLAFCKAIREDIQPAMEHTFLEMFGIGVYGEFFEEAQAAAADLMMHPKDRVMKYYRKFVQHRNKAGEAIEKGEDDKTLHALQQAYKAIIKAQKFAELDFLFLHQIEAELMMEIYPLKWKEPNQEELEKVKNKFKRVLEIDPHFAPAHIHLAKIALAEGNLEKAKTIWETANAIAPFNKFVFDFRDQVEEPNPNFHFNSGPIGELST